MASEQEQEPQEQELQDEDHHPLPPSQHILVTAADLSESLPVNLLVRFVQVDQVAQADQIDQVHQVDQEDQEDHVTWCYARIEADGQHYTPYIERLTLGDTLPLPEGSTLYRGDLSAYEDRYIRPPRPRLNVENNWNEAPATWTLEASDWLVYMQSKFLTLAEVLSWTSSHKPQKVLLLDRNWMDLVLDAEVNVPNRPHAATTFFYQASALYFPDHDTPLQGKIHYAWQEEEAEQKSNTFSNIFSEMKIGEEAPRNYYYKFSWEIEYAPGEWYPLRQGSIPGFDAHHQARHYSTFPSETLLGWRGPCLLWEEVEKTPRVWWYEE